MKIYKLHTNPYEEMDLEEAIDYLQNNCHFKLEYTSNVEESTNQSEMLQVLLEAYFFTEITDEEEPSEDDTEEREEEYKREQL